MGILQCFLPFFGSLLYFINHFFWRTEGFNFNEIQCVYFYFMVWPSGSHLCNCPLIQVHKDFSPVVFLNVQDFILYFYIYDQYTKLSFFGARFICFSHGCPIVPEPLRIHSFHHWVMLLLCQKLIYSRCMGSFKDSLFHWFVFICIPYNASLIM